MKRQRILVRGIVQGVGFRPFVYGLAVKWGLTGFVLNNSEGILLEVQGEGDRVGEFVAGLRRSPPPLAVIDDIRTAEIGAVEESSFRIVESVSQDHESTPISPDIATCGDCLQELFDPADRRFGYPFINCTNCGPRFTIICDIPYDRPNTTMAKFKMCGECEAEYHSPENRRFHAQPNACAACGPKVWFERGLEKVFEAGAVQVARDALARGEIVAIKGIGGFHLAAAASNEETVARLRERKGRREKPFALMARDLNIVSQYANLGDEEKRLLSARQRPIVLLRRKADSGLARSVAPGNPLIGFMLPYTPLHHLLIGDEPLVMTSGNLSEEPIVWKNEEALSRLGGIADAFLLHNREIHVPCDDSVVTVYGGAELPIRRSRGFSPMPVKLSVERPMTLSVGAELKACFCLTNGRYAYMSQHIGDMENLETIEAFERALEDMKAIFRCEPQRVICDAHPGYLSTRWAREYAAKRGLPLVTVQHHHAHAMAVMAENGLKEDARVLAFAFDGTGYGTGGAIWGGEVLVAGYQRFERLAHLKYAPLPGGDSGVRHPARVALAQLFAAGVEWDEDLPCVRACSPMELRVLKRQLSMGSHAIPTSSMGRLFDAVAALIGLRSSVTYEGQAAIELEALCAGNEWEVPPYPVTLEDGEFDVSPMWQFMIGDLRSGVKRSLISARFHRTVAEVILSYSRQTRESLGLETVALTGGVFQNVYLLTMSCELLKREGFHVLTHRLVPPNDGGIALGQAVVGLC